MLVANNKKQRPKIIFRLNAELFFTTKNYLSVFYSTVNGEWSVVSDYSFLKNLCSLFITTTHILLSPAACASVLNDTSIYGFCNDVCEIVVFASGSFPDL